VERVRLPLAILEHHLVKGFALHVSALTFLDRHLFSVEGIGLGHRVLPDQLV
jgi:hypothetical protein